MSRTAKKSATTRRVNQPAAAIARKQHPKINKVTRGLQTKGRISSPNDAAEHEADATASNVMSMNVPASKVAYVPTSKGGVFRQISPDTDQDKVSAKLTSPYIARFADVSVMAKGATNILGRKEMEEVQRQPEEEIQRQPEEEIQRQPEEEVQRQPEEEIQRQPEEEIQRQPEEEVQRQPEEEVQRQPEEDVQRQPEEEVQRQPEEEVQRQPEEEVQRQPEEEVQRQPEEEVQRQPEEEVQRQEEEETLQTKADEELQRQAEEEEVQRQPEEEVIQRKADDKELPGNVAADINSAKSGGTPLPLSVRKFMEPRFEANFSNVRVHTDDRAAQLNKQVSAKAFATGNHIFFAPGQYQPETDQGKELLAHELTHTIQQGGAVQRKEASTPTVNQTSTDSVQRLGISDALDHFAEHANHIPGFRMFTVILGVNPINMSHVDRSPGNILRALIEFIPGGAFVTQALDNHGVFDRVSTWVAQQIETLGMVGSAIRDGVDRFLDSLSWSDIFDLGGVWQRAKRIFTEPIGRIISFAKGLITGIVSFIKEAILRPLAQLAKSTIGEQNYDLLIHVLGYDPITGDSIARSPEVLIGGFMRLIGQEEVWNNIQRSNALPRAWAWFQGAIAGVVGFVTGLPARFVAAFEALKIEDLVLLPQALGKVMTVFGSYVGSFISWAGGQVLGLLQIIFEVVAPGAMPFIRRAAGAFNSILRNPIGFLGNLVRAGIQGFRQFAGNFLEHLKASLMGWITGTMEGSGIYIPQAFSLHEIVKFILSVMGLTWANIRGKLVRVVGETAVGAMERGFEIVKTLVTEGPAAAWQQIVESLTNLKEMVIEQIMSFVATRIVAVAIQKLITSLNPAAGAVIEAILAIYNTIMFFVERLRQIGQVVVSFVNSIAAIAAGNIAAAAGRVERTLAGLLTLVVSFLARLAGLGRVSDVIKNIVNRIREPIDRALDRVVAWIVRMARAAGNFLFGRGGQNDEQSQNAEGEGDGEIGESVPFSAGGEGHRIWIAVNGQNAELMMASSNPKALTDHLADFRNKANDIEDDQRKSQVLGWINAATPLAVTINNDSDAAARIANPDDPQRRQLDDRIEANEAQIRPLLASILDAVEVDVPERIDPAIPVVFTAGPGLDLGEYDRQLRLQQAGINDMVVSDWIANRQRYVDRRAVQTAEVAAGTRSRATGRDPRAAAEQSALRARTRSALVFRLMQPQNYVGSLPPEIATGPANAFVAATFGRTIQRVKNNGFAQSTAERKVNAWMSQQAALHSPDQVAGGRHDELTGLGSLSVNSSIGSNWNNLVGGLHSSVTGWMQSQGIAQAFWRQVKMHVNLRR